VEDRSARDSMCIGDALRLPDGSLFVELGP
jgi:hypothetical protein